VVLNYGPCGKQHWKNSTVLTIADFGDDENWSGSFRGKQDLWISRRVDLLNILKWVVEKYTTALIHQPG
jgi:hypothetical protein